MAKFNVVYEVYYEMYANAKLIRHRCVTPDGRFWPVACAVSTSNARAKPVPIQKRLGISSCLASTFSRRKTIPWLKQWICYAISYFFLRFLYDHIPAPDQWLIGLGV